MGKKGRVAIAVFLVLAAAASLLTLSHALLLSGLFLSPVRVVSWIVLPTFLCVAAVALLFARPKTQLLGLVCGLAVATAIFGAELYREVRAQRIAPEWTPWRATPEVPYPPICGKYVMVMERDGSIRSALGWPGNEVQPVAGISRIPFEGGGHSDDYGFNNPPGQWRRGDVELMAIGDSFAAGADVLPGQGFVDLLRKRLGPTINLGCSWNGPLLELASLVEYGPIIRPKTVMWFFYEGNDLTDLELEMRSPLLLQYLEPGFAQELAHSQAVIDKLLKSFTEDRLAAAEGLDNEAATPLSYVVYGDPSDQNHGIDWTHVVTLQNIKWSQALLDFGRYEHTFKQLGLVLARAAAVLESWNGRLIFVYLPSEARFATAVARAEADAYRRRVLAEATRLELLTIDLTPIFARHPEPRSLFRGHYTPAGNTVVAETVASKLRQSDLSTPSEAGLIRDTGRYSRILPHKAASNRRNAGGACRSWNTATSCTGCVDSGG